MVIQKGSFFNFRLLCTCQIGCSLTLGECSSGHLDIMMYFWNMCIIYIWLFQNPCCIHIKTFTCSLQTIDCASWHRKNSLSYVKVDGKATPHWRQLADHIGPPSFRVFGSLDGFSSNKMIWKEGGQTGHHLFLGFLVHPYCFFVVFCKCLFRSFLALPDLMHLVGVSTFIYFSVAK